MISLSATTVVGRPSAPMSRSPTWTCPIVVQPSGLGSGVSSASALPRPGRAAKENRGAGGQALGAGVGVGEADKAPDNRAALRADRLDLVQGWLQQVGEDGEVLAHPPLDNVVDGLLGQVDHVVN